MKFQIIFFMCLIVHVLCINSIYDSYANNNIQPSVELNFNYCTLLEQKALELESRIVMLTNVLHKVNICIQQIQ